MIVSKFMSSTRTTFSNTIFTQPQFCKRIQNCIMKKRFISKYMRDAGLNPSTALRAYGARRAGLPCPTSPDEVQAGGFARASQMEYSRKIGAGYSKISPYFVR